MLARALQTTFAQQRPALILGTMADKDYTAICKILAPLAQKIFSRRRAAIAALTRKCWSIPVAQPMLSIEIVVCHSMDEAFAKAANELSFVVVTGSLYFIGEAMESLGLAASSTERGLNDYTTVSSSKDFWR